jgi:hypothetical protein
MRLTALLRAALTLSAVTVAGCSDPLGADNEVLSARVLPFTSVLRVTNVSSSALKVFVIGRDASALIDLAPCDQWPTLGADESGSYVIPKGEKEMVVWHCLYAGGVAITPRGGGQLVVAVRK